MLRRFRLEEPESVKDASDLLAQHGESAKLYAGGTELLLAMKEGLIHYERLVNVKKVPSLDGIRVEDGSIHIGALSTHRMLAESSALRERLPAFVRMESHVANIRVREVGTLGGNLCFAEPHADPGTLLLVLGAKLFAAKGSSSREIPVERFFVDAYESCLEPDEILTGIQVPLLPRPSGVAYLKFGYLERPSVGVAVRITLNQARESIVDARIAVGCAGPVPRRVKEAARSLTKAGEVAGRASEAISDLHGSQEYKEHIVGVLLKRAFQQAQEQCV